MANPSDTHGQENKADIVSKLYKEVEAAAKAKDFPRAEALRAKMLEVDPMALTESIGSAEIIEQEKATGLNKDHLRIWNHLYGDLTQEEINCIFYSMKRVVIPPKKIILSHGAYNTRLFLIDSGKVTIIFPQKGKNTVLAQLGPGSLLGEYSFTSISLCSATAVSHTEVVLYYLDNTETDSWDENNPGLYEKVTDFCRKHGSLDEISRWKTLEKRSKPRYPAAGAAKAILLTKEGKKTSTYFRGSLSDISLAGTSLEIKLSKKATARALLARRLLISFEPEGSEEGKGFEMVGKIVKVSFFMQNEYCLHIHFHKNIKKDQMQKMVKR